MKPTLLILATLFTTTLAALPAAAAEPEGPQSVPLDGGLGLLALAGGAYAARQLRMKSRH